MSSKDLKQIERYIINNEATLAEEDGVFTLKIFAKHGERRRQGHSGLRWNLGRPKGKIIWPWESTNDGWCTIMVLNDAKEGTWLTEERAQSLRKIIEYTQVDKNLQNVIS